MAKRKIDSHSWNAALDAAALLLGRGYYYIRRPLDPKTMACPVEITAKRSTPRGDYTEWCHCNPDDEGKDVAAVLSLKKPE